MPTKSWKKNLKKLLTYGSWKGFFLCSPACPKEPRSSFPFYKFSYTFICAKICASNSRVIFGLSWTYYHLSNKRGVTLIDLKKKSKCFLKELWFFKFWCFFANIYLVRNIKPPNQEFCFSQIFSRIFLRLNRWKRN